MKQKQFLNQLGNVKILFKNRKQISSYLFQFPFQSSNLLLTAVRYIQSWRQSITEYDALSLCSGYQRCQMFRFLHGVQFPPVGSVLVVVFWCVDVHVHAPFFQSVNFRNKYSYEWILRMFVWFDGEGHILQLLSTITNNRNLLVKINAWRFKLD